MKKSVSKLLLFYGLLVSALLLSGIMAKAQVASKVITTIPDSVNTIVTASCTPCHTSQGGLMSKSKLNLTEWSNYSPEKQKDKAAKIYSELNKGAMPPKSTREKRPDLIPTKEQVAIIRRWSESFPAEVK